MSVVGALICWALFLQSLEHFRLKAYSMDFLKGELPRILVPVIQQNMLWNVVRLGASILGVLQPSWPVALILVICQWTIAIRWRGTVNGGSDFMTFHVLLAWGISLACPEHSTWALTYLAVQLVLSYFVAGLVKVRNSQWRTGQALSQICAQYGIHIPGRLAQPLALSVMAFEIAFPLALIWPLPFVLLGLLFHFVNVYLLGLHRFFWAWLAAYPALLQISLWKWFSSL